MKTVKFAYNNWISGNPFFICDRCSQRYRRSAMLREWTGLWVCAPCYDVRPPEMSPPDIYPEGIPFWNARPPQDNADRLQDDSYLYSVSSGVEVTTGTLPPNDTGQTISPGQISPRNILVDPLPGVDPDNILEDDITLITGVVQPRNNGDS